MELTASSGSGFGCGSGSGYGSGYGDGDGYGDGSGCGCGCGCGCGYGSGVKAYFAALAAGLKIMGARLAFWRSNIDGSPANSRGKFTAKEGETSELPGPLRDSCGKGAFHGTEQPSKWHGKRLWLVALHEPVKESGDKIWSLKRTIIKDLGTIE